MTLKFSTATANADPSARPANRLLAALPAADYAHLQPHLRTVRLKQGDVLFEAGEDVHTTYFPCHHTMASLLILTEDSREIEAATIGREGAVGGIVSAGNKPAFGRMVAQIPGEALAIATARLEQAKGASPRLADLFARFADALLAQVMQSAACNALHSVEQRCCRWLLATHDRAGRETFQLTQTALAEMLGVQRTTVTAVASLLQSKGLIRYQRGHIDILDRRGLERAACGCYAAVEDHYARLLADPQAPAR